MKRPTVVGVSVIAFLLTGVLLARAAWPDGAAPPTPHRLAGDRLTGSAGWHYRHSQPTHWRSCLLQQ
jgi:hypothetical protein